MSTRGRKSNRAAAEVEAVAVGTARSGPDTSCAFEAAAQSVLSQAGIDPSVLQNIAAHIRTLKPRPRSDDELSPEEDAYMYACDLMEAGWRERAARGVEIGTEGSLCDGIAWIFDRMKTLEQAAQATPRPLNSDQGGAGRFSASDRRKMDELRALLKLDARTPRSLLRMAVDRIRRLVAERDHAREAASRLAKAVRPVACYAPRNGDPDAPPVFDSAVLEKGTHLHSYALFPAETIRAQTMADAALAELTRYSMYAEDGKVRADRNLNEGPWVRFSEVRARWPRFGCSHAAVEALPAYSGSAAAVGDIAPRDPEEETSPATRDGSNAKEVSGGLPRPGTLDTTARVEEVFLEIHRRSLPARRAQHKEDKS